MPRTSPLKVMTSASSWMWRGSMFMPSMTLEISSTMVVRAASMPSTSRASMTELERALVPITPSVVMHARSPYPSTSTPEMGTLGSMRRRWLTRKRKSGASSVKVREARLRCLFLAASGSTQLLST
ncbi:hypothetical protein Trco_003372 [Trichoderma cornu-damae]|uniref:Uncharacterized protein n=1 Tax=Trichoderma cornu-damae TaxID=654480 RepID=A0A9P8TX80_9HYPO|nr:hypothetical protein Trco_003372 [Trichoderma cornu-damae]